MTITYTGVDIIVEINGGITPKRIAKLRRLAEEFECSNLNPNEHAAVLRKIERLAVSFGSPKVSSVYHLEGFDQLEVWHDGPGEMRAFSWSRYDGSENAAERKRWCKGEFYIEQAEACIKRNTEEVKIVFGVDTSTIR